MKNVREVLIGISSGAVVLVLTQATSLLRGGWGIFAACAAAVVAFVLASRVRDSHSVESVESQPAAGNDLDVKSDVEIEDIRSKSESGEFGNRIRSSEGGVTIRNISIGQDGEANE